MKDEELLRKYHGIGEFDQGTVDLVLDHYFYQTIGGRMEALKNGEETNTERNKKGKSRL